ncbi:5-beta-cholestane-3-alpha,7-alpha-diol 12-alpha-hydroxylase-like [Anolis carolinensis]|uniref:5-beta-cholestane-3-alpha,7-alpha-diol 12-alpha-hydroxylase-like n=1 Tax=Anolis carolinensis TaxID=28377 RepID=UPI0002039AB9|nr:PREDICTED: 5-beta-cholestane-3-alpha,7-alpha-diol 12-alpha-hydroxylase-like [Anolis carolinensis]|eukprot:XP_003221936.1 PREDICTED: 5-beta-cholestane-3-alpha,7-alpha-diol 12-alpha-hydroxylase-like [Anolis carolinensis]
MDFCLTVLCALLAAVLGGLYLVGAFRKRRANEPPVDKGLIPWLGHGLNFRNNIFSFLQQMHKKHGDVFTVLIAGHYYTFLIDPLSFGAVVKEVRAKLDYTPIAFELVSNVFALQSSETMHQAIETISVKHLSGDGLEVMTQAMMDSFQKVMLHDLGSREAPTPWKQDGLFHFCYNMVFRAGYFAFYGNKPGKSEKEKESALKQDLKESEEILKEFRKYDQLFFRLSYSLLSFGEKKEVESLWSYFWNTLSVKNVYQKDNISGWINDHQQLLAEIGMPEHMRDRFMFCLLSAVQGNTGPASFWLLAHLLKNPQAMEEVRKEVTAVVRDSGQEPGNAVLNVTREMLSQTPVLDSTVKEVLRMRAAPMVTRAVLEDMQLKMNDGRVYALRKGDRVAIFPYLTHMDPEIHPQPLVFKHDRFLTTDGNKKEFFKNGKKVKYATMPWGAGVSVCRGRFLAVNEIKLFAFLMVTCFEMELVNPEDKIPPIEKRRYGFSIMHPTHDIQFRYRLRY